MMAFVLKGLDGDLFTLFYGVSVDLVLWHSCSCSMDLSMMHELCFPCARLMKFMYIFSLHVSFILGLPSLTFESFSCRS
jgi:hypothetical protein